MQNDQAARKHALERLAPFVGEWTVEATFPTAGPAGVRGRAVFEWALGGQFLVQRTDVPHPDAPDTVAIVDVDAEAHAYTQHYFDSRGVVRVYAMSFGEGVWKLSRESPDFSPLSFSQRFTGTFDDDGDAIRGRWETSSGGSTWEHDLELTYTKAK